MCLVYKNHECAGLFNYDLKALSIYHSSYNTIALKPIDSE